MPNNCQWFGERLFGSCFNVVMMIITKIIIVKIKKTKNYINKNLSHKKLVIIRQTSKYS